MGGVLMSSETNPIIVLAEFCQKQFHASIHSRVTDVTGPCHMPTITAEIQLPDGKTFLGTGNNKKEAKQEAARSAIFYLNSL
jgi:dsRNA-specific ribonuclease